MNVDCMACVGGTKVQASIYLHLHSKMQSGKVPKAKDTALQKLDYKNMDGGILVDSA